MSHHTAQDSTHADANAGARSGPLRGIRVLEFPAIGPVPLCTMLLSDMGADVLRIDRSAHQSLPEDISSRGKRALALNLKSEDGLAHALQLIEQADVLVEGFRPGTMERLGLGPDRVLALNRRIIYGRMTGWGQTGPLSQSAGHDLNFIALAGALAAIGPRDGSPVPPLNLVGDYGGGSLFLAFGIAAALFERSRSRLGQVIDSAMVDGVAAMLAPRAGKVASGKSPLRGHDLLDGSAHYYQAYQCSDGEYVSIAAIEPAFYAQLWEKLGDAAPADIPTQDPLDWPRGQKVLGAIFRSRPRSDWCALLEGTDVCFAPVLDIVDAKHHPQLAAREVYVDKFGITQPNVAPRFSRTPGRIHGPPIGADESVQPPRPEAGQQAWRGAPEPRAVLDDAQVCGPGANTNT